VDINAATGDLDPLLLRQVFGRVPSGVVAVAALIDGIPAGLAASTFVPVSLDPPLVAICVQHTSTTWPRLRGVPELGVSVLAEHHHGAARQLAGPAAGRFAGLSLNATPHGAVILGDATAGLVCGIEQSHRAGDHDIVVLRVHAVTETDGATPLVFHASTFHGLRSAS
jgi:flavin reductase (DIM6/NTAB) family NADH-FMN oxidoreductase RutF